MSDDTAARLFAALICTLALTLGIGLGLIALNALFGA